MLLRRMTSLLLSLALMYVLDTPTSSLICLITVGVSTESA